MNTAWPARVGQAPVCIPSICMDCCGYKVVSFLGFFFNTLHHLHAMLYQVKSFLQQGILHPMEYWVKAMEDGLVHVDAVNKYMEMFGAVFVCERETAMYYWQTKCWLRYWALKPSPVKFWTSMTNIYDLRNFRCLQKTVLSRIVHITALWEDLSFLYNLNAEAGNRLAWLLPELARRLSASLRFAWIAAVAR